MATRGAPAISCTVRVPRKSAVRAESYCSCGLGSWALFMMSSLHAIQLRCGWRQEASVDGPDFVCRKWYSPIGSSARSAHYVEGGREPRTTGVAGARPAPRRGGG